MDGNTRIWVVLATQCGSDRHRMAALWGGGQLGLVRLRLVLELRIPVGLGSVSLWWMELDPIQSAARRQIRRLTVVDRENNPNPLQPGILAASGMGTSRDFGLSQPEALNGDLSLQPSAGDFGAMQLSGNLGRNRSVP